SIFGIWAFVFATGLSASVVRAAIMGSLLLLAGKIGRKSSAFNAILVASSVMVFLNPSILIYDVGFQLSFAAVIGIIYLAPHLEKPFVIFGKGLSTIMAGTIAAQLLTIPIISYHFGRVSLISLLANILILPFVPILMLLGFLVATIGLTSLWLASLLAFIPWVLLSYFFLVARELGSLSFAEATYEMSFFTAVAIYLILFEVIYIFGRRAKVAKEIH
ncbi:MAG: ComEC/Rec2 family competence protein, partial [Patescibacteria group bacterium]|nr:ComEC/Rec2 family competence protein [Patescibacteria group bacterium]